MQRDPTRHDPTRHADAKCDAFGYHDCDEERRRERGDEKVRRPAGTKGYPESQPVPREGPAPHRLPGSEAPREPQNSPNRKPHPSS